MGSILLINAVQDIRDRLALIEQEPAAGPTAKLARIHIGRLTAAQFADLNTQRASTNRPALPSPEIDFLGRHLYRSRRRDRYTIDDMVEQIVAVMQDDSTVQTTKGKEAYVNLVAASRRADPYGNQILDTAAFNVSDRSKMVELYSTLPKGDHVKPQ